MRPLAALLLCGCLLLAACACAVSAPAPAPTPVPTPTPLPDVRIGGLVLGPETERVDLSDRALTLDELRAAFNGLPRLRSADLHGCGLSDDDMSALKAAFPGVEFAWEVRFFDDLCADERDIALDLSGRAVDDLDALMQKLRLLPQLEHVDMCGCGVDNAGMERLMEAFPHIRFVWLVRISGFELRTDAPAFSLGQRRDIEGVRVIDKVYYDRIGNEDIEPLKYCLDLVALDIGHAEQVTDISCLAGLVKLRYLVVAIMELEDLSPVENMQELVYLECFNNNITDISPVASLPKLKYLNCGMNPFTDASPLMGMTRLERLWMNRSAISREDWRALEAALPDTIFKCAFDSDPNAYGWRSRNQGYLDMQKLFGLRALGQY